MITLVKRLRELLSPNIFNSPTDQGDTKPRDRVSDSRDYCGSFVKLEKGVDLWGFVLIEAGGG